jgi:hypothetical protein
VAAEGSGSVPDLSAHRREVAWVRASLLSGAVSREQLAQQSSRLAR